MRACERTRERLSEGIENAWVEEHLRGCEPCRTYADGLDAVLHHAPHLVPAPPGDLAARVREDLGLPAPAAPPTGAAALWARMTRRTPAGTVAAIAGALLGAVVVVALTAAPPPDDDPAGRLAAVGESHAGQGTSYAFDAAGEVALRLPGGEVTEGQRRLFAELGRLAGAGADADPPQQSTEVTVEYRVQGATDGRGALGYELRWRVAADRRAGGSLEVVTVDERTWVRTGDAAGWVLLEGRAGFDLGVAEVPHHLGEVLATLDDVEEAGRIDVVPLQGVAVEHLRARTARGLVVDAWVGQDDGWLRRLRWLPPPPADERDGTSHGEMLVRLRDHGSAQFLGVPDDWRTLDEVDEEAWPPFLPEAD